MGLATCYSDCYITAAAEYAYAYFVVSINKLLAAWFTLSWTYD